LRQSSRDSGDTGCYESLVVPELDGGNSLGSLMHPNSGSLNLDWNDPNHAQHLSHYSSAEPALGAPSNVSLLNDASTEFSNNFSNFTSNFYNTAPAYVSRDLSLDLRSQHISSYPSAGPAYALQDRGKEAIPRASYPYRCPHCSVAFLKNAQLQRHIQKHNSLSCTILGCSKSFGADRELQRHIRDVHNHELDTKTLCGRLMRRDNALRHKRESKCKTCNP